MTEPIDERNDRATLRCVRRHLAFGWWSLWFFLTLGVVLEAFHGFKVGWYMDASNASRRLMWTLAHAHGALLGLVHIAFGVTLRLLPAETARTRGLVSACLIGGSLLLPGGFFLGGVTVYGGDPGLGILLVPPGAILLLGGVFLAAWGASRRSGGGGGEQPRESPS